MRVVDFTAAHIDQATIIANLNYEEERGHIPALPTALKMPDLTPYVENGLGVSAFDGDTMLGFLCCVSPFEKAFASTDAVGVFSPLGANGVVGNDRAKTYALLYQAAGAKWVRAGASSHAVCLYAHDKEAQVQFYRYGFGLRCIDAIRDMSEIAMPICDGYAFSELAPEDVLMVLPLENRLDEGYIDSPFFMYREPSRETDFLKNYARFQSIYFVAKHSGKVVAFIRAELDGETFIKDTPSYLHCKGLYCLPEHRGKGVSQNLLNFLVQKLRTRGYARLGVDFESFNPSGSGFWLKYFTAYSYSVVRRIDESVVGLMSKK